MRKYIVPLFKKILQWPQSKPFIILSLHKLGMYEPTKRLFLYLNPTYTVLITEELGHLEAREIMNEIQIKLDKTTESDSVIYL